ncbi:MAG: MoaD/ThiS family protein [Bradymonadaceae bacterium]|nr:MoaD/ThiS family protein [Lujinxingiaceae bacterium]
MAVNVRIPTPLRKFTSGKDIILVEGATVGEALENLTSAHPELRTKLFSDNGQVRRFVNVFANEEDIRFLEQLNTAVADGDQVSIIPAIAGGRA